MGERAIFTIATAVIGKVHASRRAFRSRIVGEIAGFGTVRTSSLGEGPTEGNLIRVVLIRTSEASTAAA